MARLTWTEGAIADLEHIRRYVMALQPAAGGRLARRIDAAATALADEMQDQADTTGERQVVYPYSLRFRVTGGRVVITAVRHSDTARIT